MLILQFDLEDDGDDIRGQMNHYPHFTNEEIETQIECCVKGHTVIC